jgi:hypothetical protein
MFSKHLKTPNFGEEKKKKENESANIKKLLDIDSFYNKEAYLPKNSLYDTYFCKKILIDKY